MESTAAISFNQDCAVSSPDLGPSNFAGPQLIPQNSVVLQKISEKLRQAGKIPASGDDWRHFVSDDVLTRILRTDVIKQYDQISISGCRQIAGMSALHESSEAFKARQDGLLVNKVNSR